MMLIVFLYYLINIPYIKYYYNIMFILIKYLITLELHIQVLHY